MFRFILRKAFGSQNDRELKQIFPIIHRVNELEPAMEKLTDEQLAGKTFEFMQRLDNGEPLDDLLPEAFAVVRDASRRVLGMRHFDVQLIGGTVLHRGKIAEMKTGEGKTLTATLPVYLNALTREGVHLVTVNDYLARRDAEWMGRIYSFLGLTTGVVLHGLDHAERQAAYNCDITYGQNNEFGFDYLRDNMKVELAEKVQRVHAFAIVDEVDSILVDEARTPLIISGPSEKAADTYGVADQLVRRLTQNQHFSVELKTKQVTLTDEGVHFIEDLLALDNLYEPGNIETVHHITQALKAHVTMHLDVDYVVRDGQVIIVDEFTGRLMPGRRWSDGLHQAVEAKEGVPIARENQTLATITFQNYFRMYKKLAGMTGTADTEAVEFRKIYNLGVVVIPTNQPMVRKDFSDVVFGTEKGKFGAVCKEIEGLVKRGQPVLVGTASIAKSEVLSTLLQRQGVRHHVLNAKQHEREAEIVAQAGRFGAVTISTNMAGRGTDILLGGNPEFLAAAEAGTKDAADPIFREKLEYYRRQCAEEKQRVIEAGGLHILGTERHESRRIDNQLRGRAGRQGDSGSSRFYVSLEDDLMKRFGGERIQAIMKRVGLTDEDAIEGNIVARAIENAQKKVEGHNFDIRKHLIEYDDVMNKQRQVIYSERESILREEGTEERILAAIPDVIEDIITTRANEKVAPHEWDLAGIATEIQRIFGLPVDLEALTKQAEHANPTFAQELFERFHEEAMARYQARAKHFGAERLQKLARIVFLQATDFFWKEHLANMDHLKEGIGLRGYGQKNPLYEYQREAFEMFTSMMQTIRSGVMQNIFIPELPSEEEIHALEERERELQRRREAAAKEVHESVEPAAEAERPDTPMEGLNRKARRLQQQAQSKGQDVRPRMDYQQQSVMNAPGSRNKKDDARKKSKQARKDRKKAR